MKKALISSVIALTVAAGSLIAQQHKDSDDNFEFHPNSLVLSRSVYMGNAGTVTVGQTLPPGCVAQTVNVPLIAGGTTPVKVKCGTAVANGEYPTVFNNDGPDGSFGVTSPIFLDNLNTDGKLLGTLEVPDTQMVTSFSSKSELAVNLSTDGK